MTNDEYISSSSRERYRRQMNKAQMSDLLGLISGGQKDLVKYDEVAKRLRARQQVDLGVQHVPLKKIVGSVGRYHDFTRSFLPRPGADEERWVKLDTAMNALETLPPVELYKIGDAYFVRDGNHRISVARANGLSHIEAYVTEVKSDVPITAEDFDHDEWLVKTERAEFLKDTRLDELRPDNNFVLTEPGRYPLVLRHIETHRYLRNQELERAGDPHRLSWKEAVESWYDNIYLPVVDAIRKYDLLKNFPDRTEADLYLWITHHREELARDYGLAPLSPEESVATFAEAYSGRAVGQTVKNIRLGLHKAIGDKERPLGMSEAEVEESKSRRAAGEVPLSEAEAMEAEKAT